MADRFIVVGTSDPRVLLDTRDKRILGTDGGEPEDQSFGRNWSWVPDELNALDTRIADLTEQLRRVIAGCEVALVEPHRARAIVTDMHEQCVRVYNGEAPEAPTGEPHGD